MRAARPPWRAPIVFGWGFYRDPWYGYYGGYYGYSYCDPYSPYYDPYYCGY